MSWVHDASTKPLRIVCSINLFVHAGRVHVWVTVLICKRLAAPGILGCDFCNRSVECTYPKTRLVELIDRLTFAIIQQYEKQPSINPTDVKCFERMKCVFSQIISTQRVRNSSFSETMITAKAKQNTQIYAFSDIIPGKERSVVLFRKLKMPRAAICFGLLSPILSEKER